MSATDLPARLIRVFLSELDERLNEFDADLLVLEGSSDPDRAETVTRLFRGAHSLKGASASVGASGIEIVCQGLEDVLAKVRDGDLELDAARFEALSAAAAELRNAGRKLAGAPAVEPEKRAPSRVHVRDNTLRVPAETIDTLLEQSGELLASHHRIDDLVRALDDAGLDRLAATMKAERTHLQRATDDLDAGIRSIRMVPFGLACEGLERVVRDTAEVTGKHVRLEIADPQAGIDRVMVDRLRDPLVQLVRNAVDHGIESPAERARLGKPAEGTVRLSLQPKPRVLEITVSDDGGGIDLERLRQRVRERGIAVADDDLAQVVFLPGVTTATSVTNLSGRGVGLDVVRADVEAMSGSAEVRTTRGAGTSFVLSLPLTITTFRVILVSAGAQTYGLNVTAVERVMRIDPGSVAAVQGRTVLLLADGVLPLVPLATVLGSEALRDEPPQIALILRRGGQAVALAVDALIDEREIYLRSLGPRFHGLPLVSGATIAGDGSIALILRTSLLVESALATRTVHVAPVATLGETVAKRVLLVDDSITTRTLERSILEAAGYDVVTAADGAAAWSLLGEQSVDLVVSDVDMPRMNGFALVGAIRGSTALRELPVILVTARENETDRQRGLDIGADAYIVKSSFRQEELLDAIGGLT